MFILLSFKEIIDKRTELSLSEWKPQVVFGESLLVKEKKYFSWREIVVSFVFKSRGFSNMFKSLREIWLRKG